MAVLPINSTLLYTGRSGLKKITSEIFYKKKGFFPTCRTEVVGTPEPHRDQSTQRRHDHLYKFLLFSTIALKGEDKCQRLRFIVSKPDIDKLAKLTAPIVAVELGQLLCEPALELSTRLVLRCVPWEKKIHIEL